MQFRNLERGVSEENLKIMKELIAEAISFMKSLLNHQNHFVSIVADEALQELKELERKIYDASIPMDISGAE